MPAVSFDFVFEYFVHEVGHRMGERLFCLNWRESPWERAVHCRFCSISKINRRVRHRPKGGKWEWKTKLGVQWWFVDARISKLEESWHVIGWNEGEERESHESCIVREYEEAFRQWDAWWDEMGIDGENHLIMVLLLVCCFDYTSMFFESMSM